MADSLRACLYSVIAYWFFAPKALACSVCAGDGIPQRTLDAYFYMTVFMTLAPFVLFGALVLGYWVWAKKKEGTCSR